MLFQSHLTATSYSTFFQKPFLVCVESTISCLFKSIFIIHAISYWVNSIIFYFPNRFWHSSKYGLYNWYTRYKLLFYDQVNTLSKMLLTWWQYNWSRNNSKTRPPFSWFIKNNKHVIQTRCIVIFLKCTNRCETFHCLCHIQGL